MKAGASPRLIDRDRLMNADKKAVGKATVKVFRAIETLPRETQLLALAAGFVLTAEVMKFDVQDAYRAVVNLMKDPMNPSGRSAQFDAMKFHLETHVSFDADADGAPRE